MNKPMKEEYSREMDSLRFSDQAKEAMIRSLTDRSVRQKKGKRNTMKKAFYIIAAAALLAATLTGAAVYTRWAESLPQAENTTQEQREQAEKTGLSQKPEEDPQPGDVASASAGGITVTVKQTLVDEHSARLVFGITGLEIPLEQQPMLMAQLDFQESIGSYGATGEFSEYEGPHGELEYAVTINADNLKNCIGKKISFLIESMGTSQKADYTALVEGPWNLTWTLQGSGDSAVIPLKKPIGDTGILVKEVSCSPLSLDVLLQLKEEFVGFDTLEPFRPALAGYRTKDGVLHMDLNGGGSEKYEDREKGLFRLRSSSDSILDIENIDAILFLDWDPQGQEITYIVELP